MTMASLQCYWIVIGLRLLYKCDWLRYEKTIIMR